MSCSDSMRWSTSAGEATGAAGSSCKDSSTTGRLPTRPHAISPTTNGCIWTNQIGRERPRQGHACFRLVRGIAEHEALIASAEDVGLIHAGADLRALAVESDLDLAGIGVDVVLGCAVAHGPQRVANQADGLVSDLVEVVGIRGPELTRDDDLPVGGERLTRHASVGVPLEERIEDRIGYPVAELVGMAARDGLGREQSVLN